MCMQVATESVPTISVFPAKKSVSPVVGEIWNMMTTHAPHMWRSLWWRAFW